ncbi:hypothetical protein D7030_01520 [Flavobacteriaceae bacterium AU392]|nr:hypothetical protein D1817_07975 [Flavobacteriaceae bacterium]RKM86557.1 hypothetical protein D7030_01520 [Flavobacteriaceae bacterium AU392]
MIYIYVISEVIILNIRSQYFIKTNIKSYKQRKHLLKVNAFRFFIKIALFRMISKQFKETETKFSLNM